MNRSYFHYLSFLFVLLLFSCSKPEAAFEVQVPDQVAPVELNFVNNSSGATEYLWDFGDGNTSTEANPKYNCTSGGQKTIKLIAKKGEVESVFTKTINIKEATRLVKISTRFGDIEIALSNATPKHRDNFIKLAESKFFDGLLFHRVMPGFMIQGGDPNSKNAAPGARLGGGGPGYMIPHEINPGLVHTRGAVSAARTPDSMNPEKQSSGSQFFIVQGSPVNKQMLNSMSNRKGMTYSAQQVKEYLQLGGYPSLDMDYTVFAYVTKGIEVVDQITQLAQNAANRPNEDVKMTVSIVK